MLSAEQTTIRRLNSEIAALKQENASLRTFKKETRVSMIALLKYLLPMLPANYKCEAQAQIADLEEALKE